MSHPKPRNSGTSVILWRYNILILFLEKCAHVKFKLKIHLNKFKKTLKYSFGKLANYFLEKCENNKQILTNR